MTSQVPEHIVIAGGGLAALRTAAGLRAAGYGGELTLVGAETRPPYDRPPLSKKLMAGERDDTTLEPGLASLGVTARLGETAAGVEAGPAGGVLRTSLGEHRFDQLVVATGAVPVALPGPGRQRFLRTIDDALALRAVLAPGLRLVIAGAGWIGAELATVAAGRGCQVTVTEAAGAPLATAVGPQAGALTARWYESAGVELVLGERVASVQPGGLELASGGWLEADEIVTAVGVRPATGWLDGSGIAVDGGVTVDDQLRASVPGVWAVGDCMAFWSARYQRRLRFEHWDGALRAPAVAAASMTGGSGSYDPVPYFWSEQFGRMIQYAGFHGGADTLVRRGDPAGSRWSLFWLAGGTLVAVLSVNAPRDLRDGRRLIEAGASADAAALADPAIPVARAGSS